MKRLADGQDVHQAWAEWDMQERREVVALLLRVTLLPTGRRGNVFDPASVQITWRTS